MACGRNQNFRFDFITAEGAGVEINGFQRVFLVVPFQQRRIVVGRRRGGLALKVGGHRVGKEIEDQTARLSTSCGYRFDPFQPFCVQHRHAAKHTSNRKCKKPRTTRYRIARESSKVGDEGLELS